MRKKSLPVMVAFWLTLFAVAGVTAASAEEAPSPKAVFAENSWDFEMVLEGAEVIHDFVVRNEGSTPLEILKVQTG